MDYNTADRQEWTGHLKVIRIHKGLEKEESPEPPPESPVPEGAI